ncbi:MAG: PilZ domain-containing protein [Syntrophaceae bacterium]|nr:PilZ domain-containing protein [Syntrophaceae bacterium]
MAKERRKRSRVPVHFELNVRLPGAEVKAETMNISLTGVLCVTDPRFQSDTLCKIRITLSDEVHVELEGKILRVDKDETAISFTSMDEQSFHHLKRIIELNAADADEINREIAVPAFK